jgi:hypothetical protein
MEYTVRAVRGRRSMKDFLALPKRIYRNNANYVPPLRSEIRRTLDHTKNPYFVGAFLELFVCYADRTPVARTALVINPRHEEKFGVRTAFFGFFESINDPVAVRSLFDEVKHICRQNGATMLEGPFNPNHSSELGLLLDQHDRPPVFFQPYNPPFYISLLEGIGFKRSATLYTSKNDQARAFMKTHYALDAPMRVPEGFTVRHPDLRHRSEEMEKIRGVFNDSFASNWHFLPASKEEYDYSARFLTLITQPELITIVEHKGKPVGVAMCVLDVNPLIRNFRGRWGALAMLRFLVGKRRIRRVIVYAVGIRRQYQNSRVYVLLLDAGARMLSRFDAAETTWMSEGNMLARRSAERLGMKPDKHFGIYAMPLDHVTDTSPEVSQGGELNRQVAHA